jgi:hypothetical protein
MVFTEVIAFHPENYLNAVSALCEENAEFFMSQHLVYAVPSVG